VILTIDAWQRLFGFGSGLRERLRQKTRIEAVSVMQQFAFTADVITRRLVDFLVLGEFFRLRGKRPPSYHVRLTAAFCRVPELKKVCVAFGKRLC